MKKGWLWLWLGAAVIVGLLLFFQLHTRKVEVKEKEMTPPRMVKTQVFNGDHKQVQVPEVPKMEIQDGRQQVPTNKETGEFEVSGRFY